MNFYAAVSLVQAAVLLGIATFAVPHLRFNSASSLLATRLLWFQALTAPCYGLTVIVTAVVLAYRRYSLLPCCEALIVIIKFAILQVGLRTRLDFFIIVVMMTCTQICLSLGPALWVMVRQLGHGPHFAGARRADFGRLVHVSFYISLIQISVVLATNIDTTVLGFALPDPGPMTALYSTVSKPFLQIRQVGSILACLVMPAAASLRMARDESSLEKIKYDFPRFHIGLLLPVTLLAWVYAAPFLDLWVGHIFVGQIPELTFLLRLYLAATLPLTIGVPVQMAIGMGRVELIALAALAGALINLPMSYVLTVRLGVSGVIWGTVLTGLFSNFLVPGLYVFRILQYCMTTLLVRTLSAPVSGAIALLAMTWLAQTVAPPALFCGNHHNCTSYLLLHLTLGFLAYLAGYLAVPIGRVDLSLLLRSVRHRGHGHDTTVSIANETAGDEAAPPASSR